MITMPTFTFKVPAPANDLFTAGYSEEHGCFYITKHVISGTVEGAAREMSLYGEDAFGLELT